MIFALTSNQYDYLSNGLDIGLSVHNFYRRINSDKNRGAANVHFHSVEISCIPFRLFVGLHDFLSEASKEIGDLPSALALGFNSRCQRLKRGAFTFGTECLIRRLEEPNEEDRDIEESSEASLGEKKIDFCALAQRLENKEPSSIDERGDNRPRPVFHFIATAVSAVALAILFAKGEVITPLVAVGSAGVSELVLRLRPQSYRTFCGRGYMLKEGFAFLAAPKIWLVSKAVFFGIEYLAKQQVMENEMMRRDEEAAARKIALRPDRFKGLECDLYPKLQDATFVESPKSWLMLRALRFSIEVMKEREIDVLKNKQRDEQAAQKSAGPSASIGGHSAPLTP